LAWPLNLMLINVPRRKLRGIVRLPEGDLLVPSPVSVAPTRCRSSCKLIIGEPDRLLVISDNAVVVAILLVRIRRRRDICAFSAFWRTTCTGIPTGAFRPMPPLCYYARRLAAYRIAIAAGIVVALVVSIAGYTDRPMNSFVVSGLVKRRTSTSRRILSSCSR